VDADFSVELGPTAPALEIPWRDSEGRLQYVDLRNEPGGIERIPEAQLFPALRQFLLDVNSQQSPWQTAKCDVWEEAAEPAENFYGACFARHCYVDLVLTGEARSLRDSLEAHERLAQRIAQMLEADDELEAMAEIVVRRCYFHRAAPSDEPHAPHDETSDAGYCLTLYLSGFGASAGEAAERWSEAVQAAAKCLLQLPPHEERAKG
jgi:hypothetical protein